LTISGKKETVHQNTETEGELGLVTARIRVGTSSWVRERRGGSTDGCKDSTGVQSSSKREGVRRRRVRQCKKLGGERGGGGRGKCEGEEYSEPDMTKKIMGKELGKWRIGTSKKEGGLEKRRSTQHQKGGHSLKEVNRSTSLKLPFNVHHTKKGKDVTQ